MKSVKLGKLCNFVNGGTPNTKVPEYYKGDIPWITSADISEGGAVLAPRSRITETAIKESSTNLIPADTVLFVSRTGVGKVAKAPYELCFSQDITALTPQSSDLETDYLIRFLRTKKSHFTRFQRGATIKGVNRDVLSEIEVPLPPLAEQKRIAAILDKADALRQKRKQSLKLLDEFIRSVFLEMFGDPVVNPKGWPVYTVGQLLERKVLIVHKDGNFGSQYPRAHEFGDSGVPFLTAKAVSGAGSIIASEVSFLNEDKANTLPFGWIEDGDVLLAHNATVGRVGLYRGQFERALIGTSLTCYRPNPDAIYSAFLFALLRSHLFQSQLSTSMAQTTRNQVPITVQRQMKLVLPPLKKQIQFDRVLKKVDKIREHNELALDSQEELFNSLVQRAFRGEL